MASEYYLLLGVPRDANLSQLRRAYRSQWHRYDPMHAATADPDLFDAMRQAFEVLSAASRRADYHRDLENAPPPVEPAMTEPIDLMESFHTHRPSSDAILDLFRRDAIGRHIPKSQRASVINVEVMLSPTEAEQGGRVPLRIPIAYRCNRCAGTGSTGFFPCGACGGEGVFWESAGIDLRIPPYTTDGTVVPISLLHLGVRGLTLNAHVRVAH